MLSETTCRVIREYVSAYNLLPGYAYMEYQTDLKGKQAKNAVLFYAEKFCKQVDEGVWELRN